MNVLAEKIVEHAAVAIAGRRSMQGSYYHMRRIRSLIDMVRRNAAHIK